MDDGKHDDDPTRVHCEESQRISGVGSWALDHRTGTLSWSDQVFAIFELDPAEFSPSYETFTGLLSPDDREMLDAVFQEASRTGTPYDCTHEIHLSGGRIKWLRERGETRYDADGHPTLCIGTVQDVTAQVSAELLAESEERYRRLVETIADGIIGVDQAGTVVVFNAAAERIFGVAREELIGRRCDELGHSAIAPLASLIGSASGATGNANPVAAVAYSHPDGSTRHLEAHGSHGVSGVGPIITTVIRDRTPEHEATLRHLSTTERRAESRRQETIGGLAGGFAHEFNNILGAILGQSELARIDARALGIAEDRFDAVQQSIARATKMIRQLVTFARGDRQEFTPVDMREVVDGAISDLRSCIPPTIDITVDTQEPNLWVWGSELQLHQTLTNLCLNAAQAIGAQPGTITVALGASDDPADPESVPESSVFKGSVHVTVTDSGPGLPGGATEKIFDPFFTTRSSDGGSGLGLSVVQGAVLQHGGFVAARNTRAGGARFAVALPRLRPRADHPDSTCRAGDPEAPSLAGLHVVVVDDSAELREALVETMRHAGAHPQGYPDAESTLAALSRAAVEVDVLIADARMPGMGGVELARAVSRQRPHVPSVLMSGYLDDELRRAASQAGIAAVIDKPYHPLELLRTIDRVVPRD